jgi:hypothetical protein
MKTQTCSDGSEAYGLLFFEVLATEFDVQLDSGQFCVDTARCT